MPRTDERNGKTKIILYERDRKTLEEANGIIRFAFRNSDTGSKVSLKAAAAIDALAELRTEIAATSDPPTPLLDAAEGTADQQSAPDGPEATQATTDAANAAATSQDSPPSEPAAAGEGSPPPEIQPPPSQPEPPPRRGRKQPGQQHHDTARSEMAPSPGG